MASRVSVAAGQKPKPKVTFKFLKKDEGRLSYAAAPADAAPAAADDAPTPRQASARRDSQALRAAIARDMRNASPGHDAFSDVTIAVPKKPPPPGHAADGDAGERDASPPAPPAAAAAAASSSSSNANGSARPRPAQTTAPERSARVPARTPAATRAERKPAWDDTPAVDPRAANQRRAGARHDDSTSDDRYGEDESDDGAAYGRYRGGTPRNPQRQPAASAAAPPSRGRDWRDSLDDGDDDAGRDDNYFRPSTGARRAGGGAGTPRQPPPSQARGRGAVEEEETLMRQLESEIRAAQEERERYVRARQQLDRDRARFDDYRHDAELALEEERAALEEERHSQRKESQQSLRAIEERYKNVSALLSTERETNNRLIQENEALRTQLQEVTAAMRDGQRTHKAEVARLRREADALAQRNEELLQMNKQQQARELLAGREGSREQQQQQPMAIAAARHQHADPSGVGRGGSADRSQPRLEDRHGGHDEEKHQPHGEEAAGEDEGSDGAAAVSSSDEDAAAGAAAGEPVVLDFSPRTARDGQSVKRAQEMEERMRRQEEEMRRRRAEREAAAAREQEERQAKEAKQREQEKAAQEAVARERKAAGHPLTTPRVSAAGKPPLVTKVQRPPPASSSSSSAAAAAAAPTRPSVPTAAEMLREQEEIPADGPAPGDAVVSDTALGDNPNKREVLYRSGRRAIHYANGTVKTILPSGQTILRFTNGDVKCTFPSGKSTYWYDAAQTMHTQMPDGRQLFEFRATGQVERHFADGSKEILYPDGVFTAVAADGTEQTITPNN